MPEGAAQAGAIGLFVLLVMLFVPYFDKYGNGEKVAIATIVATVAFVVRNVL